MRYTAVHNYTPPWKVHDYGGYEDGADVVARLAHEKVRLRVADPEEALQRDGHAGVGGAWGGKKLGVSRGANLFVVQWNADICTTLVSANLMQKSV